MHRPLGGALVAVALLAFSVRAQPAGVPAVVERLLLGFAATDCPRRWRTIEEFMDRMIVRVRGYQEPTSDIAARLRERAPAAGAAVGRRVELVAAFVEDAEQAIVRLAKLQESAERSGTRQEIWQKALEPLAKALDDPNETFLTRRLASAVIAQSARKSATARDAGWDQPVPRLLSSNDPTARLLGSLAAASGTLLPTQAPAKGQVVPVLIRALDADSFAERYESTHALLQITDQPLESFCVDPSDDGAARAPAVRAWQTWWDQNKARLSGDMVAQ